MPAQAPEGLRIAVLTPISRPSLSSSGPPELPGLIGAVVWITPEMVAPRKAYFEWFAKAAHYKGGQRFQQYINEIKQAAVATLTANEKEELETVLEMKAAPPATVYKPRPLVKQWTLDELAPLVEKGLTKRD